MSAITTHVLDTALGKPAVGVSIHLEKQRDGNWIRLAASYTDGDGRCRDLGDVPQGIYRLTFFTGDYLAGMGRSSIYPDVSVAFKCEGEPHYHLPLLLSDNGYTTYRGS